MTGKVKPPRGPGGSRPPVSQGRAPQPCSKHSPSEAWSEKLGQWSVCSASSCRCCSYGKTQADPGRWTTLCALWVSQSQEPADHGGEGPLTVLQGRVAQAGRLGAWGPLLRRSTASSAGHTTLRKPGCAEPRSTVSVRSQSRPMFYMVSCNQWLWFHSKTVRVYYMNSVQYKTITLVSFKIMTQV